MRPRALLGSLSLLHTLVLGLKQHPRFPVAPAHSVRAGHPARRLGRLGSLRASSTAPGASDSALELSPLVTQIEPSKTIEVHALTQAMRAAGEEVVSLCVGEPDFLPPQAVLEATGAAVTGGETKYTAVSGTGDLRAAIAKHLLERKGTAYTPEEILLCNGAKQAVYQGVLATCRPGDEVVVPAPYWPSYPEIVRLAGATPVVVSTTPQVA